MQLLAAKAATLEQQEATLQQMQSTLEAGQEEVQTLSKRMECELQEKFELKQKLGTLSPEF